MEKLNRTEVYGTTINSPDNLVPPENLIALTMGAVFDNYAAFVDEQKSNGRIMRGLNESSKIFWREVDNTILQKTNMSFFKWFYLYYFEKEYGILDVHQFLTKEIKPLKLMVYSAFYRFINERFFIATRTRKESLQTPVAQTRLSNRTLAKFTKEELSARSKNGWETRRLNIRKKVLHITELTKDLPN